MIPRVKVCGMRERYNVEALCQLPVQYMGLIFYGKSSRFVACENTLGIDPAFLKTAFYTKEIIPEKINKVGVFVNEEVEVILEKVEAYQLDYVQLHGQENVFYCKKIKEAGIKIIKAFPVDERFSFTNLAAYEYYCDYFLFDTKGKLPGGNGIQFNWEILQAYDGNTPFFLSGGIGPDTADAIINFKHKQLYAIDINSGFENRPGFKNVDMLSEFLNKINKALRGRARDW